jgi:hypothetical protein
MGRSESLLQFLENTQRSDNSTDSCQTECNLLAVCGKTGQNQPKNS